MPARRPTQVKTLSFLTYLLRGFADLMKPFTEDMSRCAVDLCTVPGYRGGPSFPEKPAHAFEPFTYYFNGAEVVPAFSRLICLSPPPRVCCARARGARAVVALLGSCPPEATATRKELLVATRHILMTGFCVGFFPHVDALLDEGLLVSRRALSLTAQGLFSGCDQVHYITWD